MNPAPTMHLSEKQLDLIHSPLEGTLFLEGPAGCGKTTVGVVRLLYLMAQGVPADGLPGARLCCINSHLATHGRDCFGPKSGPGKDMPGVYADPRFRALTDLLKCDRLKDLIILEKHIHP